MGLGNCYDCEDDCKRCDDTVNPSNIQLNVTGIDNLITFWRNHKIEAIRDNEKEEALVASCYVDAFQTVRVNHGLELLPAS